jgi:WD40 repeat protein
VFQTKSTGDMQTKDQNAANQQAVQVQYRERQENALALFRKESHEFLMKDYLIALKEGFPGLGIRYITYHEPDQTLLISNISNGRLHLLNLATGSYRWFEHHKTTIRKIKYFRGEILTSSWDGSVRATHYHTLKERLVMTEKNMGRCPYFNISPDGKYLYSFSYDSDVVPFGLMNTVRKWSLKTGKLVSELAASGEQKGSARSGTIIIHNGLLYVCGDSGYFRIFDAATERLIKEINEDANFRSMTSLIHHGYLLASDWNGGSSFFQYEHEHL